MSTNRTVDVNGEQPRLEGLVCDEIQAVQFWHAGQLEEPVNVAHLKFGGTWFRLYFDHGIVFWRRGDGPQGDFDAPEVRAAFRLDDIGRRHDLIGLTLASVDPQPTRRGSRVVLTFHGGRVLTFFDEDDRTDYAC